MLIGRLFLFGRSFAQVTNVGAPGQIIVYCKTYLNLRHKGQMRQLVALHASALQSEYAKIQRERERILFRLHREHISKLLIIDSTDSVCGALKMFFFFKAL